MAQGLIPRRGAHPGPHQRAHREPGLVALGPALEAGVVMAEDFSVLIRWQRIRKVREAKGALLH